MSIDLLPDSRLKSPKNAQLHRGINWVPLFCASCGKAGGGSVPEENCDFAFYLCDPCALKMGPIENTYAVPDEVFFAKVKAAQIEEFGRELTPPEMVEALKDGGHILSKLASEKRR